MYDKKSVLQKILVTPFLKNGRVLYPFKNKAYLKPCINDQFITYALLIVTIAAYNMLPGRLAQSVTCLTTDACLTAIPGVGSSIPARSHTFVEIDH